MCQRVTCKDCGKPSFRGCGRHIEQVLGDVSPADVVSADEAGKDGIVRQLRDGSGRLDGGPLQVAKGRAAMKATVESVGNVASRTRLGEHGIVFDQPCSVPGGEDRGPSPLDLMAVSVAVLRPLLRGGVSPCPGSGDRRADRRRRVRERARAGVAHRTSRAEGPPPRRSVGPSVRVASSLPSSAPSTAVPRTGPFCNPPRVEISIEAPPAVDRRTA